MFYLLELKKKKEDFSLTPMKAPNTASPSGLLAASLMLAYFEL